MEPPATTRPSRHWTAGDWALGGSLVLTLVALLARIAVNRPAPALASAAAFCCTLFVPYVIATRRNLPAPSWMVNSVFWVPLLAGIAAEVIVGWPTIWNSPGVWERVVIGFAHGARGLFYGGFAWAALLVLFGAALVIRIEPELRKRARRGT